MPWIGRKKVAFVPTYRPRAVPPDQIPENWEAAILRRALYDPDPMLGGMDGSLRAWLRAASSGRADLDAVIFPMRIIDRQNVLPAVFEEEMGQALRDQGFDHAAIVMLGGVNAGSNAGYWSRFVMAEHNGVWAMEIMHGISGFQDLYWNGHFDPGNRAVDRYDEMSHAGLSHPTAFTKAAVGWLDDAAIARHAGPVGHYALQFVGLPQPPSEGRVSAVRIGTEVPYVMVEARKMNDQFETGVFRGFDSTKNPGIPADGLIAYRIQTSDKNGFTQDRLLPLFLLTQTALRPGESATLDDGVILTNTGEIVGGYTIRIEHPSLHVIDRTAVAGAARAASDPTSCLVPALDVENIAFRDSAGRLHELWRTGSGQGTTDLTGNAGAPLAKGNPFAYVDPTTNQIVLLYRGRDDNDVHSLYWSTGAVGHDNLTGSIGAPKTAGDPAGWFTPDGIHHVVYRSADGHLRELWWSGQDPVQHGDLTAAAGAGSALGDPSCYADPVRETNIVVFRGAGSHIRSLYWSAGPVGEDDLSGFAGTPAAAGNPFAYFTAEDDMHQVVYRVSDGRLFELRWIGVKPVAGRDLTALAGAVPAASDPVAGYEPNTKTKHVYYRSSDGHLRELWWRLDEEAVRREDLTAAFDAPPAAGRPTFFTSPRAPYLHLAYRGADAHVHEILW